MEARHHLLLFIWELKAPSMCSLLCNHLHEGSSTYKWRYDISNLVQLEHVINPLLQHNASLAPRPQTRSVHLPTYMNASAK